MYITLLLLVWILYVFTSFSNVHLLEFVLYAVWILYVFTSFSNISTWPVDPRQVWILYVFTSFSNRDILCAVHDGFEYYTFLHHSQTHFLRYTSTGLFEYYTFLHHSQTKHQRIVVVCSLNTIRFYIILKPQIQKWSASSALIVWYSNLEK